MSEKKLYDNVRAVDKDGNFMFYCSIRKAESYLRKKNAEDGSPLAEIVSRDPFIFRLLFDPKGKGNPDMGPKINLCERCGTTENLTKHHIVPYAYRKILPDEFKNHRSEEVVPLCRPCHDMYEHEADVLKDELELLAADKMDERMRMIRGRKARRTLENHTYFMPEDKMVMLRADAEYWKEGMEIPTPESIVLSKVDPAEFVEQWKAHYRDWLISQGKQIEA